VTIDCRGWRWIGLQAAVLACLVPRVGHAQDSAAVTGRPITLAEAVQLARVNSPLTIAARGAEVANRAAVRSAYGAFLPNLTASVGAVRQFTGAGNATRVNSAGERVTLQGASWIYSNGFSLSAQLFNASRIPALHAAKADVVTAQQTEVVQGYAVTVNVEQQFFSALAAREGEDAARIQLQEAAEALDATRRRVRAGAATPADSLTAVVQVANARLALLQARNAQRDASAALTRLVGSATPVVAAATDPEVAAMDTVTVDSAAVETRAALGPSVMAARAALASARARRQVARAGYLPTLNAGYSRGGSGIDSRFGFGGDPFTYSGQLNLSLSVPIFNQFSTEEQVARATVTETNAAAALRDVQLQAHQLTVQYLDALRLGQEQIALQTASIVAAEEGLRVQQQRYDVGLATIVDVLTAETTLNQARANLIVARNVVRAAAASISALIGQPLSVVSTGAVR